MSGFPEGAEEKINTAMRIDGEAAMSAPPFFQSAGRGDLLGAKRRTNGSNMGEPIRTRKVKLAQAGRVEHDARLGRVVQVKKRGGGNPLI